MLSDVVMPRAAALFRAKASKNFTRLRETTRFGFVYKAHPPVHIRICAGGCNAIDGRKDKQGGGIFLACALRIGEKKQLNVVVELLFESKRRELNSVFQFFTGFELDHVGSLDLNDLTGLGISTFAGLAAGLLESTKAYQGYLAVLFLQSFGDAVDE
jgi:hypothetical protein